MRREEAVERTLAVLRFFSQKATPSERSELGYQGFYYHCLDMETGQRVRNCELSTIDTAILIAGMLAAKRIIRTTAQEISKSANGSINFMEGSTGPGH
jgi:hypothetical protein